MRSALTLLLLLLANPASSQGVDFGALQRYAEACHKLEASILTDQGPALHMDDHIIDWISECNGNIPACWSVRDAIRQAKRAAPLDCLGRVQSHEAAEAAYSLYLAKAPPLPKCIERRC